MATEKTYNGWTNYETWNVNLWMNNDAGSDERYRELAQECYNGATDRGVGFTKDEQATFDLAQVLKDEYEEAMADILDAQKLNASVWADLLGAALSEVNWHEIAEHLIGDVDKTKGVVEAE